MNPAAQTDSPTPANPCLVCDGQRWCIASTATLAQNVQKASLLPKCKTVLAGRPLFSAGQRFKALYSVRNGLIKTVSSDLHQQVVRFSMPGSLLGLDALATAHHPTSALALEDSQVCQFDLITLDRLGTANIHFLPHLLRSLGREFQRQLSTVTTLASPRATAKLAGFLIDLVENFRDRGDPAVNIPLLMSREDIGSHLGLSVETISRTFSEMARRRILRTCKRRLVVLDMEGLQEMAGRPPTVLALH